MKKVLVADNEPAVVHTIACYFEEEPALTLVVAHSKETATEVLKENPDIQVVVLDTDCLGEGGILDIVRMCTNPPAKTILWTGAVAGWERPEQFGVDRVVLKPGNGTELMAAIHELLAA